MLSTITIFQLALLIALIWKTVYPANHQALFDIDAFLTTVYGVGGGLGVMSYTLAQNSERLLNRAQDMCGNTIMVAFAMYACWFWFRGINELVSQSMLILPPFQSLLVLMRWSRNTCPTRRTFSSLLESACMDGSPRLAGNGPREKEGASSSVSYAYTVPHHYAARLVCSRPHSDLEI